MESTNAYGKLSTKYKPVANRTLFYQRTPKQTDGTSCGVFSCLFMEAIVTGQDLFNYDFDNYDFDSEAYRRSILHRMANAMISAKGFLYVVVIKFVS